MVTFWADAELLSTIDSARKRPPKSDRSQFIRDAIVEKLRALGFPVDAALAEAPDRAKVVEMHRHKLAAEPAGTYRTKRTKRASHG